MARNGWGALGRAGRAGPGWGDGDRVVNSVGALRHGPGRAVVTGHSGEGVGRARLAHPVLRCGYTYPVWVYATLHREGMTGNPRTNGFEELRHPGPTRRPTRSHRGQGPTHRAYGRGRPLLTRCRTPSGPPSTRSLSGSSTATPTTASSAEPAAPPILTTRCGSSWAPSAAPESTHRRRSQRSGLVAPGFSVVGGRSAPPSHSARDGSGDEEAERFDVDICGDTVQPLLRRQVAATAVSKEWARPLS